MQTNCYIVAREPGAECVVIDPGMTAGATVRQVVEEQQLQPVAVLLTHGHLDHVFAAREVTERFGVPAYIHDADREMLGLRFEQLAMDVLEQYARQLSGGAEGMIPPADTRSLPGHGTQTFAGFEFTFRHAPGHTPGCTLLEIPYAEAGAGIDRVVFSGDVLFAGSIGRTDLPGGDPAAMIRTLRDVVLALPDTAAVLSGHGGQTTIGRERATNPYLQESML